MIWMKLQKQMEEDSQSEKLCFYVDWSFLHTVIDKLVILLSKIFLIPFHKGFFTLYSSIWIILTLHLLIIWNFTWVSLPPFFHIHRTHPYLLSFLEGSSSCWDTNWRYASHIREGFPPRTFLQVSLTYEALCWAFTSYWQSPQMFYYPQIVPWPNILFRAFAPTIASQNSGFSLPSKERKWGFDLFKG